MPAKKKPTDARPTRHNLVQLRLTDEELELIDMAASVDGRDRATFIRHYGLPVVIAKAMAVVEGAK